MSFVDLISDEIATARLVDICDADLANTDECDCGCAIGRGTICAPCKTKVDTLLMFDTCPNCGDAFRGWPWWQQCPACREAGEIPPAMARAAA
jgi:hypothetical protein